jgi:hypothetical protein
MSKGIELYFKNLICRTHVLVHADRERRLTKLASKYNIAVVVIALSMVFATFPLLAVRANPGTTMCVSPATISDAVTNNYYTVTVNVTDVTDLYAWEFQLSYNSTVLSLVTDSVVAGASGGLKTPWEAFIHDNTAGNLHWAVSTTYPNETGISYADHAIFQIEFEAVAAGTTSLTIHDSVLVNSAVNTIDHTNVAGSIAVGTRDLTVTSIIVLDHGCSIYANDTYSDGLTPYYVPVLVTINNAGTMAAGAFNVSLAVYWLTGSMADGYGELRVASLAADTSLTLNFTAVFHPTHTHYYSLTATVDVHNEVVESNKANNVLVYSPGSGVKVTVIGDINGDGTVGLQDAVIIAQAWNSNPSSSWWNIKADINHDNSVDLSDAGRISLSWGKSW